MAARGSAAIIRDVKEGSYYAVAQFPANWPLERPTVLISAIDGGDGFQLRAEPDGSFSGVVVRDGAPFRTDRFEKVMFAGGIVGLLSCVWDSTTIRVSINDTALGRYNDDAAARIVKLAPRRPPRTPIQLKRAPGVVFNRTESLFLDTIEDIQQKLSQPSHYNLIRAAGLLRQLLLDGAPLVHQVNREYREILAFEVVPGLDGVPLTPEYHWCDISPDTGPPIPSRHVNLPGFLATPCLAVRGQRFSVHEVISCCANVLGGVHWAAPKTERELSLVALQNTIEAGSESMIDATLRSICSVAVWGLEPLLRAMFMGVCTLRGPHLVVKR